MSSAPSLALSQICSLHWTFRLRDSLSAGKHESVFTIGTASESIHGPVWQHADFQPRHLVISRTTRSLLDRISQPAVTNQDSLNAAEEGRA